MSEGLEHATPRTIADIAQNSKHHLLAKVRTCGTVLRYIPEHAVMVLSSGEQSLLVDARLCVKFSVTWLREPLTTVIVIGYVESIDENQFEQAAKMFASDPSPSAIPPGKTADDVRIQALFIKADPHVDIREWEEDCDELPGYLKRLKASKNKNTQEHK